MAADIATGVPKPAAPSMNAPKLNAISRACRRRSLANPATVCLTTSKSPDWTVTSYTKMAHSTIQPIGNKP